MNTIRDSVCNVCGKPATNGACDLQEIVTKNGNLERQIVPNSTRFGCVEHQTKSITYDIVGNVVASEMLLQTNHDPHPLAYRKDYNGADYGYSNKHGCEYGCKKEIGMLKNYRISVDGLFYTGEQDVTLHSFHADPWSGNSFQTKNQNRNVLTFEPRENNHFKVITGRICLLGEIKRIIEFVIDTGLMAGNEIIIEAEPYKIPLELNIDHYLDIEVENSVLKALMTDMKTKLDIATDLGQKRFEEKEKLRNWINGLSRTIDGIDNMETCSPLTNGEIISLLRDIVEESK